MFRVMDVPPEGPATVVTGEELVAPPPAGSLRWIDLEAQDAAALELLRQRFDFHPLALEDCAHFDQRPKLEEYGTYIFVVTHGFLLPDKDVADLEVGELHAFLGKDYLVTVHTRALPALETVWKRVAGDAQLVRRGIDFVLYLVVDSVVDSNFPVLDAFSHEIEELEDRVLLSPHRSDLSRLLDLKRALVTMRRVLSPQRDVFGLLSRPGDICVSERTSVYFRDVYDHLVRIYETIDTHRDLLGNAFDAYLSMVSNRTNDIMKRLTVLSAIFLPLTFITGFFGQNFEHLPFGSDALMIAMIVACVAIPTTMLVWFYRSRWL